VKDCIRCHTPLPVDGRFCSNCGTPSEEFSHDCPPDPTEELKERLARTLAGRYEIIRLLGKGGMAVVFLAQDLVLEREVAIKVLPPGISQDTKLIPRFQQEAKTAAKLDHPNIIPIYRVESEAGLNYFVMKFVNGRALDQVLDDGPLSVPQARRVLREAALALGHAHQRKIVHRDVKPANIMLEGDGRVVLTDFGISKAAQGSSHLTGTGAIIGTPHYMAPEQAKGLEVDGRADQYALGIVGHQLLTGKVPFDGTAHSILYKQVFEPPPPVIEVRPDTPRDLSRALERALSKEPEHRFPTMEDFAAAVSGDSPVSTTVVSAPVKTATRSRTRVSAKPVPTDTNRPMLVAFTVAAIGIGVAAWLGLVPTGAAKPVARNPVVSRTAPTPVPAPAAMPERRAQSKPEPQSSEAPKLRVVKKEYALLTVASEPWATLYIDNVEIGPTPVADYRLLPGTYRLRLEQEGYRTKRETLVISGPNPIRRRYSLEPQPQ
jgi:serine/threonine protein kinase